MVGEHHHVVAVAVDGGVGNLLEVWRVRRHTEETHFAGFLGPIERFVNVGVHETLDGIARMHVHEVDMIRAHPLEAAVERV